jgi:hypothetical protein
VKKDYIMSHIAKAVEPVRVEAIARATKEAFAVIAKVEKALEAAGGDRKVLAPFPNSFNCDKRTWNIKKSYYTLVHSLTERNIKEGEWAGSLSPKDPDPARMSPKQCAKFVKQAQENASAQYDAFIAKLEGKVGETTSATLSGEHVWGHSILTVTKADGSVERWKTQMIVNVSVLGNMFNQWPSRKVK